MTESIWTPNILNHFRSCMAPHLCPSQEILNTFDCLGPKSERNNFKTFHLCQKKDTKNLENLITIPHSSYFVEREQNYFGYPTEVQRSLDLCCIINSAPQITETKFDRTQLK